MTNCFFFEGYLSFSQYSPIPVLDRYLIKAQKGWWIHANSAVVVFRADSFCLMLIVLLVQSQRPKSQAEDVCRASWLLTLSWSRPVLTAELQRMHRSVIT